MHSEKGISLGAGWNEPVEVFTRGGGMHVDEIKLSGGALHSEGSDGLTLAAASSIDLQAEDGQAIRMLSPLQVDATGNSIISSDTVQLHATGWGKNVELSTAGGHVAMDALHLRGRTVGSGDTLKGLHVHSSNGVLLDAGQSDTSLWGQSVAVNAQGKLDLRARKVHIQTLSWNSDIVMSPSGGHAEVDSIEFEGSHLSSTDLMKPLLARGLHGLTVGSPHQHALQLRARSILMAAAESVSISAAQVSLETSWQGATGVQTRGGALSIDELRLSGTHIHADRELTMSSGSDIQLQPGSNNKVLIHSPLVVESASTEISSEHITLSAKKLQLGTTGGDVALRGLRLGGPTVASPDVSKELRLHSRQGIALRTAPSSDIHLQARGVHLQADRTLSLAGRDVRLSATEGDIRMEGSTTMASVLLEASPGPLVPSNMFVSFYINC